MLCTAILSYYYLPSIMRYNHFTKDAMIKISLPKVESWNPMVLVKKTRIVSDSLINIYQ